MIRKLTALFFAFVTCLPFSASAATDMVELRILPGWKLADGSHMAALQLRLKDGWKTYWRSPGDAGIAPQFNWSGSLNLDGVEVNWPTPQTIMQQGVRTIGYTKLLVLPLKLTPAQTDREIVLKGELQIGVCSDICVPVTLNIEQALPRDQSKPDPRIIAALANRPYSAREAKVSRVSCEISMIDDGLRLRTEIDLPSLGSSEIVVVETDDPQIWVAQSTTRRQGGRLIAETDLYDMEGRSFALQPAGLRITILGAKMAVDIQGCPAG